VSRTASPKEIKLTYFRESKKCHPDLYPDDPKAKIKFQQLCAAYESIKLGMTTVEDYTYYERREEEHTFQRGLPGLLELFGMLKDETLSEYEDLKAALKANEWAETKHIVYRNKETVLAVLVPTAVLPFSPLLAGLMFTAPAYLTLSVCIVLSYSD